MKNSLLILRFASGFSGSEKYTLILGSLLHKKNIIFRLVTNNTPLYLGAVHSGYAATYIDLQIKEAGTKTELFRLLFELPRYVWKILPLFSESRLNSYSTVLIESNNEKILLTIPFRLLQKRVIWIEHGPFFKSDRSKIYKYLYKIISRFTHKIICVSKNTESDLEAALINVDKTECIYLGLPKITNIENSDKLRLKQQLLHTTKFVIVFLGEVNATKGIFEFLEVINLLPRDKYMGLVIGAGPDLDKAKAINNKIKNKSIKFLGFVKDPSNYLEASDVLLMPTVHDEGISQSILEAIAANVIVVTKNSGGNSEIIENGKNGYFFNYHREAVNIIRMLQYDRTLLSKIQKQARAVLNTQFNADINIDKFISRMFDEI